MAFSWKNRTIQNGEKLIFSVAIGIGTLNTPPTIRVTSQLKNSYYQGEVVDVQGYVNDVDNGDINSKICHRWWRGNGYCQ